jgi:hypothetical protein
MKQTFVSSELTNSFEIALHQTFRKLQVGEPDQKIRKAIDKASRKVTVEVKRFMKERAKLEEKRRKKELKKLREQKPKHKRKELSSKKKKSSVVSSEIVESIIA